MDIVLNLISKYASSHMYDIYAFLSGTIAYVVVMVIKVFSGKKLNKFILCIAASILGAVIFIICSNISPQVQIDTHAGRGVGSILYASGIAFAEIVLIDMLSSRYINIVWIIATFAVAFWLNIYLCDMMHTHYKACYGIKLGVAFCCAIGLVRMVINMGESEEKQK